MAKLIMKKMGGEMTMAVLKSQIELELERPTYTNKKYEKALGDLMIACFEGNFTDISNSINQTVKSYLSKWKNTNTSVPWWQKLLSSPVMSE